MTEAEMRIVEGLRDAEIMSRWYKREATLWKDIAVRLANAGICQHCDQFGCSDKAGWHKAFSDAAALTNALDE